MDHTVKFDNMEFFQTFFLRRILTLSVSAVFYFDVWLGNRKRIKYLKIGDLEIVWG